ncbi:unnamed protein product [Bursaphelenchus okinawaensis]|uniref:glutathione transferase n=1 Tax=Bursaphelenchus okinawaensis TaxID=465554 RepID=A0A811KBG2_9BILA|nr:unnamed protein product [Bursaphelenchus okinawaensis]CAG9099213.1 unnamed protein product [Bursaphelenchus okinawaensis]
MNSKLLISLIITLTTLLSARSLHSTHITKAQHSQLADLTTHHPEHKKFKKMGKKFRKMEVGEEPTEAVVDGTPEPEKLSQEVVEEPEEQHVVATTEPAVAEVVEHVEHHTTVHAHGHGHGKAHKKVEKSAEITEPELEGAPKPKYKLIYFDARGICESIRLLFRYANQTFVDERISKKKWLAIKDTTFYGKIPILEVDGKPLAQCYAISRYLAKQFNLSGKDDWEAAKLDEAADFHKYVLTELSPYLFVLSGYRSGDRDALRKDVFVPIVDKNFPIYNNLLKASNSGFFAKSGVSWVDFVISEYMTTIRHYEPAILEKYPLLVKFIDRVQSLPQIKEYIKQRNHTPLQFS